MFSKIEISQKMTHSFILFVSLLYLSLSSASDVTHILGRHPELSTFSNYITQTQLAHEIDSLHTITILTMANSDMGPLSGKPIDQIKKIISAHVLLDYYDLSMLKNIKAGNTITVQNLLHANINITVSSGGNIEFRYGANLVPAQLVRSVDMEPYILSVLQISGTIIPCAIEESPRSLAEAPQQSKEHSEAPQQGNQHGFPPPPPPPPPPPSPKNGQSHAPEQQQHSNTPPPSDSQDHHNAPQPSSNSDSNKSSPSPKGDSPSSSQASDAPSFGPTGVAPSLSPEDVDSSADGEGKGKSSAAGMSHDPFEGCWIVAILISVVLGNLV